MKESTMTLLSSIFILAKLIRLFENTYANSFFKIEIHIATHRRSLVKNINNDLIFSLFTLIVVPSHGKNFTDNETDKYFPGYDALGLCCYGADDGTC